MSSLAYQPISRFDKYFLVGLTITILAFAAVVETRSAFMQRRMTDADCYFRGAWAVRAGEDLYEITDDSLWHYNYPPLLAILLTPLADAPAGVDRSFMLPYPVSVAIWFWLTLACGAVGIHWLARSLEEGSPDPWVRGTPVGCQRWWRRRLVPFLICLPPIGHSLMRGQVNLIILMVFAGMIAAQLRGRRFTAGLWLAGAICVKIFPAFLLIFPLWRRDGRFLAGTALGLMVGLLLVPGIVLGPSQTVAGYAKLTNAVLLPGLLNKGGDDSRAVELTNVTSTDSQGFPTVLHNTLHPDPVTRPHRSDLAERMVALGLAGLVTLATLLAIGRRLKRPGHQPAVLMMLAWGIMILPMLFASPVAHLHYYCWCVPMVMALLALVQPRGRVIAGWLVFVALFHTVHVLVHIPEWGMLRDLGLAMYGGLVLWVWGMAVLLRSPAACSLAPSAKPQAARQAA
jgi:alpha-1,2-mannosyltransferase